MGKIQKNSKVKTLLIISVGIIWGAVILRTVSMFSKTSEIDITGAESMIEKVQYQFKTDTFTILAAYRDPFLNKQPVYKNRGRSTHIKRNKNIGKTSQKKPKLDKLPCTWPGMKFGGIIYNNTSNGTTALFEINGRKKIIQEGDMVNDLKIETITSDSIIVSKENCFKTIHRNNENTH